jgi:hypothetical protein
MSNIGAGERGVIQTPSFRRGRWGVGREGIEGGGPRVEAGRTGGAIASFFQGSGIDGVACVAELEDALAGERRGVAAVAGGEDAVEHVHPGEDGGEDVSLVPDAHEVAGLLGGEHGGGVADDSSDIGELLADGDAADGVPREIDGADALGGPLSLLEVGAPLDNSEEGLHIWALMG